MNKSGESALFFLAKHLSGDWGTVCPEDAQAINEAVGDDGQRASTCLLLPEEY
jgi:hypothetical protein